MRLKGCLVSSAMYNFEEFTFDLGDLYNGWLMIVWDHDWFEKGNSSDVIVVTNQNYT